MVASAHIKDPEIACQIQAFEQRRKRLAKLSAKQAKLEALQFLMSAGIVTRQGKLTSHYR